MSDRLHTVIVTYNRLPLLRKALTVHAARTLPSGAFVDDALLLPKGSEQARTYRHRRP